MDEMRPAEVGRTGVLVSALPRTLRGPDPEYALDEKREAVSIAHARITLDSGVPGAMAAHRAAGSWSARYLPGRGEEREDDLSKVVMLSRREVDLVAHAVERELDRRVVRDPRAPRSDRK